MSATHTPYVTADQNIAELTVRAIVLGIVLGALMTAANTYLGLYMGMTVSAYQALNRVEGRRIA